VGCGLVSWPGDNLLNYFSLTARTRRALPHQREQGLHFVAGVLVACVLRYENSFG
jgi:hypothetical protein